MSVTKQKYTTHIAWFQGIQSLTIENYITVCSWTTLFSLPPKYKWKAIMSWIMIELGSTNIQMEVTPALQKRNKKSKPAIDEKFPLSQKTLLKKENKIKA